MNGIVEIRAVERTEMADRVVRCLEEAGVPHVTVSHAHAVGTSVAAAAANVSAEEGAAYAERAIVQFICAEERGAMYAELLAKAAHTGRRGDGIVSLHPVAGVRKIRTGAEGLAALAQDPPATERKQR